MSAERRAAAVALGRVQMLRAGIGPMIESARLKRVELTRYLEGDDVADADRSLEQAEQHLRDAEVALGRLTVELEDELLEASWRT